jgi:hypothetical protein
MYIDHKKPKKGGIDSPDQSNSKKALKYSYSGYSITVCGIQGLRVNNSPKIRTILSQESPSFQQIFIDVDLGANTYTTQTLSSVSISGSSSVLKDAWFAPSVLTSFYVGDVLKLNYYLPG